jgi:flagellar biosynthetic protein FlhB
VLLLVVVPAFCALEAQSSLLFGLEGQQRATLLGAAVRELVWRIGSLLGLLAAVSYGLARWKFFREHRMSLHELREEHREGEGDPHLKAARKHEHAALVMADLERRVRRSKVIVVRRAPRQ